VTALRVFGSRLRGFLTARRREAQLSEEIETHLDLLTDEFVARGLAPAAARTAARREFGGIAAMKDSARDETGLPWIESWLQDVRYALRQLRRQPAFASAAILTLAIGIGGSTGIFSIVDAVLVRPLPYPEADRLVALHERAPGRGTIPVSPADADVWRRAVTAFDALALLTPNGFSLTGTGEPEQVEGTLVSPSLFPILGLELQLGRALRDDEDAPGRDRVVVISDRFWRRHFTGDPQVIGRTLTLDGVPHEVVGVLAARARPVNARNVYAINFGPGPGAAHVTEIWKPLALTDAQRPAIGNYSYAAVARLRPGVPVERARAELASAQANLVRDLPTKGDVGTVIVPLQEQIGGQSRRGLQLLLLAVAAVLIIGCANIANLLLARALVRHREMAVRQALGAGRLRLMRQLLVESLTLCGIGGVASLGVGYAVMRFLVASAAADVPRLDEVGFDARVLLFAVLASMTSAALVGILPAWRTGRVDLTDAMKTRAGQNATRTTGRVRSLLVASQIAVSAACLVIAGLLLQSFVRLLNVDKGFSETKLVTLEFSLVSQRYPTPEKRAAFVDTLLASTHTLPGVTTAAAASRLPLTGTGANSAISREGTTLPIPERPLADFRSVTPDYFGALGLPLRSGRLFTLDDRDRPVAVLSAGLARQAWPGEEPLGRKFRFGSNPNGVLFEVIGVVGDARNRTLDETPTTTAYVPYPQGTQNFAALIVNTGGDPGSLSARLRQIVRTLDPEMPVAPFRTLDDVVDDSLSARRFQLQLVGFFAACAALLSALGVYGLMAYAVAQRTNEFGVRLALGARPSSVIRLVARDALRLLAGGLALAAPVVLFAGPGLRLLLFDVKVYDARTLLGVGILMTASAIIAAYIPGRRASRIQPSVALHAD